MDGVDLLTKWFGCGSRWKAEVLEGKAKKACAATATVWNCSQSKTDDYYLAFFFVLMLM